MDASRAVVMAPTVAPAGSAAATEDGKLVDGKAPAKESGVVDRSVQVE